MFVVNRNRDAMVFISFSIVFLFQAGRIEDAEMSRTFNMGIGMVLVMTEEASRRILEEGHHKAYRIGEVVHGEGVSYH
jgi:phosphoribosylformylglycinamidine cyclo-ligase